MLVLAHYIVNHAIITQHWFGPVYRQQSMCGVAASLRMVVSKNSCDTKGGDINRGYGLMARAAGALLHVVTGAADTCNMDGSADTCNMDGSHELLTGISPS